MIRPYNKSYLHDVMRNMADLFDISINQEGLSPKDFTSIFLESRVPTAIEKGNPTYLCGKTALEMLIEIIKENRDYETVPMDRSREYWAGWVLAFAQWSLNKSFKEILSLVDLNTLISLYNPYHEAPLEKTVCYIASKFPSETALKRIRQSRNITQEDLSLLSGVNIRNIRSYEQKNNSINKASGDTLFSLAKALGCSIEDLLEFDFEK